MNYRAAFLSACMAVVVGGSIAAAEDTYFPPPDKDGGWRAATEPAKALDVAQIDTAKLDRAFDYTTQTSQSGGLVVVRHGWLVYEKYYGRGNREAKPTMASIGKAFTSIACGIMLHEKHDAIPDGLDTKIFNEKYLPESLPLDDPRKAEITLGQVLSMAAGLHGEGNNPGFVNFQPSVKLLPIQRSEQRLSQDMGALRTPLWTDPGGGYSYASNSPHVASIVLRHIVGMEMQQYLDEKVAKPLGFGAWGYGTKSRAGSMEHTPGGGNIAMRSTDITRAGYMLLHHGMWKDLQIVPADYVEMCGKPNKYQKHAPFSLMYEVNADGHVIGAPHDAFFKSGGGGFGLCVIPSLDLVIYKMAGDAGNYDPEKTGLPLDYTPDTSRDKWVPNVKSQFSDGPIGTDDGLRRTIEMVVAAVNNTK